MNSSPGLEAQSAWHGMYFRRLMDDYVALCADAPPSAADTARPLPDGRHVPHYFDDGWALLLGRGRGGTRAAFDVVKCGERLVRARREYTLD